MSTITVGDNTYTLSNPMPTEPGLESFDQTIKNTVAVVSGAFVPSRVQTQLWPGADGWAFTCTTPKMGRWDAAKWRSFLASCQGPLNVFQFGDPINTTPLGQGDGTPVTANGAVLFGTVLPTKGWTPNVFGQLLAGDYIQVGYRLYQATEDASSDSDGNANISVFPSLREVPSANTTVQLGGCQGVFRLTKNQQQWSSDYTKLYQFSFQIEEVR